MRLEMDETVDGLVDEACRAHTSHIDVCIANILHVEALDAEGEEDCAVYQVLNDNILLALVLGSSADHVCISADILDQEVVAGGYCLINNGLSCGR